MKIIFTSTEVELIKGKAKSTGNDYEMRKQQGFVELSDGQRLKAHFTLDKEQAPYKGEYELADESFHVDDRGSLQLRPFGLTLVPSRKAAA